MKRFMQKLLGFLPERFKWTIHNLLAHPLCEIIWLITGDADGLASTIHDITVPEEEPT